MPHTVYTLNVLLFAQYFMEPTTGKGGNRGSFELKPGHNLYHKPNESQLVAVRYFENIKTSYLHFSAFLFRFPTREK